MHNLAPDSSRYVFVCASKHMVWPPQVSIVHIAKTKKENKLHMNIIIEFGHWRSRPIYE